jgi:hypothetical protein
MASSAGRLSNDDFCAEVNAVIMTCNVVAQFALAIELDAKDHYDTAIDRNRGLE